MARRRCSVLVSRLLMELTSSASPSPKRTDICKERGLEGAVSVRSAAAGLLFMNAGMLGNTCGFSPGDMPMNPASSLFRLTRPEGPSNTVEPTYTRL